MEQKFSILGSIMEAANHSKNSAMEAENHVKHGASSKSHTSRGNLLVINKMKKLAILASMLFNSTLYSYCQITTTRIEVQENVDNAPYDSTTNFCGNKVNHYIGQSLYVVGIEKYRIPGYSGFVIDFNKSIMADGNNYKGKYGFTEYDNIVGKYFLVLDAFPHPKSDEKYFLKLKEKENGDILYYEYNPKLSIFISNHYPFLIVGYYEKLKKTCIGNSFIFSIDVVNGTTDIKTKVTIPYKTNDVWVCKDLINDMNNSNTYLSLIFENSSGKTILVGTQNFDTGYCKSAYTVDEARKYTTMFGKENFDLILNRKVKIGMTEEMCLLSRCAPEKINETITAGKKTKQWVCVGGGYLYFENGKLIAIQNN